MDKIDTLLTRRVVKVLPSREKLAQLLRRRKIRLYFGVDPTGPHIHLGHAIPLRKLREFQKLGHEVILLFGTFTAQIGDPSEREERRKPLTFAQIRKNMATYKDQVGKILNLKKTKIEYNHHWLGKLTFPDLLKLTSHFTISQLLEREMFQRRLKKGKEVWISEFLYPLMQGYDSVVLNVDLEIGSTDQTFNMLVGRKLQKIYNRKEKFILTTPMLIGLDGKEMSKTYKNTVNLTDPPGEMYGKIMSLRDSLIIQYFDLCTDIPSGRIKTMEKKLKEGRVHPMDLKKKLAWEIVRMYHSATKAKEAQEEFERVFQKRKLPLQVKEIRVKKRKWNIITLLLTTKLCASKSEAKRLIRQKAVDIDGRTIVNPQEEIELAKEVIIKIGKRQFIKVRK